MIKEKLFKKLDHNWIQCLACHWYCRIPPGKIGICGVRENLNGKLNLMVENQAVGLHPDPVEKKPLYHFLPGSKALSFGTLGCNFACDFCQNWFQSQSPKRKTRKEVLRLISQYSENISPKQIVKLAQDLNCLSIAYTYNEPAVFIEYALATMAEAKKAGLKNVFVTNGFESKESFELAKDYLDAANIDLKSFKPDFYQKICHAKIEPVLENIKRYFQAGVWIELTTLVIPGLNDSVFELEQIAKFIAGISQDIPWHTTAFHPDFKMLDKKPTGLAKLKQAWQIGKKAGLKYVYTGNVFDPQHSATFCPSCGKLLISRNEFFVANVVGIKEGKCQYCQAKIAGVWS